MDFRRVLSSFPPVMLALLIPASALAQGAWVPRKGEGVFSISSQWLEADRHLVDSSGTSPLEEWFGIDYDSNSVDWGKLESMAVVLDADVGVTDRLAVTGGLAFMAPRYTGNLPDGPGDDGDFHGSIQDARIGARFVAVNEGPWAVTPFAAFVFPTTDYAIRGHTAPGLGLKELQVGATVGRLIDIGGLSEALASGSLLLRIHGECERGNRTRSQQPDPGSRVCFQQASERESPGDVAEGPWRHRVEEHQ